ncbi:hypothetical protein [uncultured Streptomyces sp.]|uniref:hypothetical protein n=1 Tax=uncultured Streptomyces sp. TaxID=174707 RepID=UPI00262EE769|nr:hypothetical protein [uncultured Streptomyces sp.]
MTTADSPQRADGWAAAVRERLGLGRLLPLGAPADGTWIAEGAAASVLRDAAHTPGTVLGTLRIGAAEPEEGHGAARTPTGPVPPAPPSAVPAGPLRIEAGFSASAERPLPAAAALLRRSLLDAAARRLGLEVSEVDLRVTDLLDSPPSSRASAPAPAVRAARATGPVGAAAEAVPGVAHLTGVLGRPVHEAADHVRVEVATEGGHRALDVARAVRSAVSGTVDDRTPVSVLVTAVVEAGGGEPAREAPAPRP